MKLVEINQKISKIKTESREAELHEATVNPSPFEQFLTWFDEALEITTDDPSAMVLSTVDDNNWPDARVVLLKELDVNQFIFYSNYNSKKAKQLAKNNIAALNFHWPQLARQVRIRGRVEKIEQAKSAAYFSMRPRQAQLSVYASAQSSIILKRAELEERIKYFSEKFEGHAIPCPPNWGGYTVLPFEYEFFQGRKWRIHDRLLYTVSNETWKIVRLSP